LQILFFFSDYRWDLQGAIHGLQLPGKRARGTDIASCLHNVCTVMEAGSKCVCTADVTSTQCRACVLSDVEICDTVLNVGPLYCKRGVVPASKDPLQRSTSSDACCSALGAGRDIRVIGLAHRARWATPRRRAATAEQAPLRSPCRRPLRSVVRSGAAAGSRRRCFRGPQTEDGYLS
jgi:hypothetical protein